MSALHPLSLIKHVGQLLRIPKIATIPGLLDFHRELEGTEEQLQKLRTHSFENSSRSKDGYLQLLMETTDRLSACLKKHESTQEFAEVRGDYLSLHAAYEKEKAELSFKQPPSLQEDLPDSKAPAPLLPEQESKSPSAVDLENIKGKKQPLKPLDKNPLKETHALGFALGICESDPYYKQYPEWCDSVQLTFPRIREMPSYKQAIRECKRRMGIEEVEQGIDPGEQKHLDKIVRVLTSLIETLSRPKIDHDVIPTAITLIYEEIYQLLICPVCEVCYYIKTPHHIFMHNQREFRQELGQCLPPGITEDLVSPILGSVEDLEKVSEKIERQYPGHKETIQTLIGKSYLFLQRARQKAQEEIDHYHKNLEIKCCFDAIFKRCPYLADKYRILLQLGVYSSMQEIPRSPSAKIIQASYFPQIIDLLKSCEAFNSSTADNRFENFKGQCEQYLKQQKPREHFQSSIVPLIGFLQSLKNILMWPQEYELSPGEVHFIQANLLLFTLITDNSRTGTPTIPYKYLSISEEDKKNAEAILNKGESSLPKKREACRLLLHARIPWAALQALGCLLHKSGGVSEYEAAFNHQLVRDSLDDLIPNLPAAQQTIEELIEFELTECSPAPSIVRPAKLSEGCYVYIQLAGNISGIQRSITKTLQILGFWRNHPLMKTDFMTPKVRYAALRTVQILGELSKNLHDAGVLSADTCWDSLEELRDLLSHPERISLFKRLLQWVHQPEGRYVSGFFEDFRTLAEYFDQRARVLKDADTWAKRKKVHESRERPANLELTGIQDLYVFLAAKISREQQLALLETLKKPQAVQAREEIVKIKEEFSHGKFDLQTYQTKIAKLPLTKIQQKRLEEAIKVIMNPKAAENNHRLAKPGMLKKVVQIIEEFKKNKKLIDSRDLLEDLKRLLTLKNYFNNPQDPETLAESQLVEDPTFSKRVTQALEILQKLKQDWTPKGLEPPQSIIIEENLRNLQETTQEFIERKKQDCQEIIETIPTHPGISVQGEGDKLIRSMQIKIMPLESLQLTIKSLGISGPDAKLWETANAGCAKKKEISGSNNKEESDKKTYAIAKKKALQCIEAILNRIQKLDYLVSCLSRDQEYKNFCQDPLLQLACQYLVSDFRSTSSSLELYLETLKYSIPPHRLFFSDIQQCLLSYVQIGNKFLHLHEVSEPGTSTAWGHVLDTYFHALQLLRNFSLGKDHNIIEESFRFKLNKLKDVLLNNT